MEREKRVHYTDNFKFSFIINISESFRYELIVKTTGLNEYRASFKRGRHDWDCENCDVFADQVTVFVNNHKLAPGKVYCHIKVYNRHDREVDSYGIDPHIILSYDHQSRPVAPSEVDAQQSVDIINLFDKFHDMNHNMKELEHEVDHKSAVIDADGKVITELYVTEDDENDPQIYTREEADARFATKNDLGNIELNDYYTKPEIDRIITTIDVSEQLANYSSIEQTDEKLAKKADLKYVNDEFYNKSEADTKFLTTHQDLADYLTFKDLNKKLAQYQPVGDYIVQTDLGDYYNRQEVNNLINEIDVNEKLDDYAKIANTTQISDNYGIVTEMSIDLSENDFTDTFYTKSQTNERFALKDETITVDKLAPYVKKQYLDDYYYSKGESDAKFLTHEDCYTKSAVDALLRQVYKAMGELEAKLSKV